MKIVGAGNSEERMFIVFRREDAKPIVSKLLFHCLLREEAEHLELNEGIQHFKNDTYDIDLVVGEKVHVIIRCEEAPKLSKKLYEMAEKTQ